MTDYDKTIEAMAKAIYEAEPYKGISWKSLCLRANDPSDGWFDLASDEKDTCIGRAKAALAALQETDLPWYQIKNLGK